MPVATRPGILGAGVPGLGSGRLRLGELGLGRGRLRLGGGGAAPAEDRLRLGGGGGTAWTGERVGDADGLPGRGSGRRSGAAGEAALPMAVRASWISSG